MNNLVIKNMALVYFVIKKMNLCNSNEYEDYFQIGTIGLIYAVRTYKKNYKVSFSTYAFVCIKNEILRYLKKNSQNNNNISFDDKIYDEIRVEDTLTTDEEPIIEKIEAKELTTETGEIIETRLNKLERKIIKMSFGINCHEYKQKEISQILDIPQYKISRIKSRALKIIRKQLDMLFLI